MKKEFVFALVLGMFLLMHNAYAVSVSTGNTVWKIEKSYISKYIDVWVGESNESGCYIIRTEPTPQLLQIYNDFKTMQTQAFKQKYSYLSDYANKKGRNIMADMNSLDKFPIKKLGKFVLKKVGHSKLTGTIDLFQPNFIEFCGDAKVGDNVEIGFASTNITLVNASAQVTIDPYIEYCLQKCEHDIYITNLENYSINISHNDFSIVKPSNMKSYELKAYLPYNITVTKYNATNITNVYNYTENFTKTDLENCNETWCLSCWDNGDNETYSCNETVYTPYNVEQTAYKFMSFDSLTIQPNETKHLKIYYDVEINSKGKWDFYFIFNNESYYIDPWWNSSWQYRKPITITEQSGNNLTNFQVAINISYDSGMQSDFDDLRFTYYNTTTGNETEIPYWIESYSASNWCYVWVNVTYIPANGNATIYIYYGNMEVSNNSDINSVFDLYDDFVNLNKWDDQSSGYGSATTTTIDGKSVLQLYTGTDYSWGAVSSKNTLPNYSYILETEMKSESDNYYAGLIGFADQNTTTSGTTNISVFFDNYCGYDGAQSDTNKLTAVSSVSDTRTTASVSQTLTTWNKYTVKWKQSEVKYYINDNLKATITSNVPNPSDFQMYVVLYMIVWGGYGYKKYWFDWVRIRKYADPEPTYTIGSEEHLSILNLTITSPTNTTYNTNQITISGTTDIPANVTYSLNGGANQTLCINCTSFSNTTTAIEGQNKLEVYAVKYDDSSVIDSEVIYFTVDTTPPTITIHSPLNTTYGTTTIQLKVSADEDISTWYYDLNDAGNVSFTPNITITAQEGQNKLIVWARDSVGNWNSSTVYFSVDTTPPTITILSPQNTTYNVTTIWLNVTADETVDTWWYNLNNTGNVTFTPNTTINVTEGFNHLVVYANDTLGNIGSNDVYFTVITNTPPVIYILKPPYRPLNTNMWQTSNTTVELNVSIVDAENNLDMAWYELWIGTNYPKCSTFTLYTSAFMSIGDYYRIFISPSQACFRYQVYANDTLNLTGTNYTYFFVDAVPPKIRYYDVNVSNLTINFSIGIIDNSTIVSSYLKITNSTGGVVYLANGTCSANTCSWYGNATISYGTNTITIYGMDSLGNDATYTYTITVKQPITRFSITGYMSSYINPVWGIIVGMLLSVMLLITIYNIIVLKSFTIREFILGFIAIAIIVYIFSAFI